MNTSPASESAPSWNDFVVATFAGQHDTHIETGEFYDTITLASLFAIQPQAKSKMAGNAFVPSMYHAYDARTHEVQRDRGAFVALVGDIDKADLPIETVRTVTERFADGAAWLIYSSAHSRDGDRRWRVVLPLREPIPFADWYDAQTAFFTVMEGAGVPMDHALSRAAQPVYLPNVPHAYKDGTPLRDQCGAPIYYRSESTGTHAPGLDISRGAVSGGIASIRQQRAADDREREILKKAAAERFTNRPQGDSNNIIERFNESTSIATMLELVGYEQSPRSGDDWRSPQQTGETYATRIIENKWVSLSASDAASGLGSKCRAGCFGDAYDLYVHYKHGGDHKNAYRELGREQRGHNVVQGNFRGDNGDPGWQEMPESAPLAAYEADVERFQAMATNEGRPANNKPKRYRYDDFGADAEIIAQAEIDRDGSPDEIDEAFFDPSTWDGVPVPPRQWMAEHWLPLLSTTYLTGLGATGKSLLTQQLATCIALNIKFLGIDVRHCKAAYITCEDDLDELHRRQEAINTMLGVTWADLKGRLLLRSLKGEQSVEFATFDSSNVMTTTRRFRTIRNSLIKFGVEFGVFDNVAHFFAGNENIRGQVAQFCGLMDRIAMDIGGATILLGHPNKTGAEFSGSTAWENQVRSRIYLKRPESDDGSGDPDARILSRSKPNYAQKGEEVAFRWHEWAFVREQDLRADVGAEISANIRANAENEAFLNCLAKATAERRATSTSPSASNFAPRIFNKMTAGKAISVRGFEAAMERLLHLGLIQGDGNVFRRSSNRNWATGIVCTNPRTNPAQSDAPSLHEAAPRSSTNPHSAETLDTTYQSGAPLGVGAPDMLEKIDAIFLVCLDAAIAAKHRLSHQKGAQYAPAIFELMPEAEGTRRDAFERALHRLRAAGQIEFDVALWLGDDRHPVRGVGRAGKAGPPPQTRSAKSHDDFPADDLIFDSEEDPDDR